jgi:hypothetical protein
VLEAEHCTWQQRKHQQPYHYIRVSRKMFDDLMVWKLFLENFNGVSYFLDKDWVSNVDGPSVFSFAIGTPKRSQT